MLVNEVKPIGKVGKNLLENKNADEMIEILIEKPLQKACRQCKEKNIDFNKDFTDFMNNFK